MNSNQLLDNAMPSKSAVHLRVPESKGGLGEVVVRKSIKIMTPMNTTTVSFTEGIKIQTMEMINIHPGTRATTRTKNSRSGFYYEDSYYERDNRNYVIGSVLVTESS